MRLQDAVAGGKVGRTQVHPTVMLPSGDITLPFVVGQVLELLVTPAV